MKWNTDDTDDTDTHGYRIRGNPSNPCHPCSKSLRQAFNTIAKNTKLCDLCALAVSLIFLPQRLNDTNPNQKSIKKFALKDDGFYKIKSRTEYPVCWSYPDGYETRYSVKGRTLHVTHDNPNKVWLDIYPGVFHGRLLESYEVLIRDDKVESYRRDYPDAQTEFTVARYRSTS